MEERDELEEAHQERRHESIKLDGFKVSIQLFRL
jgi:hypothetical protein